MVLFSNEKEIMIFKALVAAKSLDPLEVVSLLRLRGKMMQESCAGKEGIRTIFFFFL